MYFFPNTFRQTCYTSFFDHLQLVSGFGKNIFTWHYCFPNVSNCGGPSCQIIPLSPLIWNSTPFSYTKFPYKHGFFLDSGLLYWSICLFISEPKPVSATLLCSLVSARDNLLHPSLFKTGFCYAYILSLPEYSFLSKSVRNPARDFVWNLYINWRELASLKYGILSSRDLVYPAFYSGVLSCPSEKLYDLLK